MPARKATRPDDKRLSQHRYKKPREKSRYQQLMDGELTVDDLDDEEIMNGKCKDKDGHFRGRPPKTFPRALHDALHKEYQKRMQEKLNDYGELAISTLADVASSRMAAAPARVRAAEVLLERTMGKVPDKIFSEVSIKPFEEGIEGLLVDVEDDNVVPITKAKGA